MMMIVISLAKLSMNQSMSMINVLRRLDRSDMTHVTWHNSTINPAPWRIFGRPGWLCEAL